MTPGSALRFLVDPRGRVSRRGLALGLLVPFVLLLGIVDRLDSPALTAAFWALAAWPVLIATPWKRLHDTGRPGAINLVFLAFYALGFGFFLGEYVPAEGGWPALFDGEPPSTVDRDLTASGLGGFSTLLIFLPIHLFWLYAIPGAKGDNAYGPPPRSSVR